LTVASVSYQETQFNLSHGAMSPRDGTFGVSLYTFLKAGGNPI
jgi:hypothetical protein